MVPKISRRAVSTANKAETTCGSRFLSAEAFLSETLLPQARVCKPHLLISYNTHNARPENDLSVCCSSNTTFYRARRFFQEDG